MSQVRIERDTMGEMQVPAEALYGASTQRAVENFPISGYRMPRPLLRALGLIKLAAAEANRKLGLLEPHLAGAIQRAAREVISGRLDEHFPVDVFQTGSGTSTNMNVNEVIANRAARLLGESAGSRAVHPNDHVNMGQSSNDVFPSAIHIAAVETLHGQLMPALHRLGQALREKAAETDDVVKIARTHLQDATPIRLGQVIGGWAAQLSHADRRVMQKVITLRELPIGGTAVGTGLNTHPDFARLVCEIINHETGEQFHEAPNHFEAQHARDALVGASAVLRTVAVSLTKIANDIRWMASGPRCGIGELRIPAVQPGSSIMPGKVNPVICEAVLQVCCQVVGNDAAIAWAGGMLGSFELHTGMPVMAHNLLESVRLLSNAADVLREKCVTGLEADRQRCGELIERSLAMCTSLTPVIGYDAAAELAREAYRSGRTVREVARERIAAGKLPIDEKQLSELLDPRRMTGP